MPTICVFEREWREAWTAKEEKEEQMEIGGGETDERMETKEREGGREAISKHRYES